MHFHQKNLLKRNACGMRGVVYLARRPSARVSAVVCARVSSTYMHGKARCLVSRYTHDCRQWEDGRHHHAM